MKGKVKWWNDSKGFGFLEIEGKRDVFAHYTQIQCEGFKTLSANQLVEFDLYEEEKGLTAKNIRKLD
jgi:CspA family cold shock protein